MSKRINPHFFSLLILLLSGLIFLSPAFSSNVKADTFASFDEISVLCQNDTCDTHPSALSCVKHCEILPFIAIIQPSSIISKPLNVEIIINDEALIYHYPQVQHKPPIQSVV